MSDPNTWRRAYGSNQCPASHPVNGRRCIKPRRHVWQHVARNDDDGLLVAWRNSEADVRDRLREGRINQREGQAVLEVSVWDGEDLDRLVALMNAASVTDPSPYEHDPADRWDQHDVVWMLRRVRPIVAQIDGVVVGLLPMTHAVTPGSDGRVPAYLSMPIIHPLVPCEEEVLDGAGGVATLLGCDQLRVAASPEWAGYLEYLGFLPSNEQTRCGENWFERTLGAEDDLLTQQLRLPPHRISFSVQRFLDFDRAPHSR